MDYKFYDVKTKKFVTTKVLETKKFEHGKRTSYAFKGKSADGRDLMTFVKKEVWDKAAK